MGLLKFPSDVTNHNGEWLPGVILMRGASVALLLILQPNDVPEEEETKNVFSTVQPRIAARNLRLANIPADMLDESGTFAGGAAEEIEEETGLKLKADELIDMTAPTLAEGGPTTERLQHATHPSTGGCDESITAFLWQRRVKRSGRPYGLPPWWRRQVD
ncbi:hypothetical protein DOTSEDRAFT_52827 [Dothistroma septosporum NZE10]|uniref:Nudix hydrolase domain-containing protein n=1 Tax=Dothistroma septosporum (strain NZE10 / CBS 128990) TaxID=675120 RepID=N1PT44_DOTSN|nr:hypothetical protein DOTSEDRAFT_52827 [Dothistroma septosporum NZE10]